MISWLHGFRKLRFVTEKTDEMQFAFLNLAVYSDHVIVLSGLFKYFRKAEKGSNLI